MSYDDGLHYFELVEVKDAIIIHVALQHVLQKLLLLKQIVVRISIRARNPGRQDDANGIMRNSEDD